MSKKEEIVINKVSGKIFWNGKEWDDMNNMTIEEIRECLHELVDEIIETMKAEEQEVEQ